MNGTTYNLSISASMHMLSAVLELCKDPVLLNKIKNKHVIEQLDYALSDMESHAIPGAKEGRDNILAISEVATTKKSHIVECIETQRHSQVEKPKNLDIAAIYGREVAATPGPWSWKPTDLNAGRQLEGCTEHSEMNPILVPYVCSACAKTNSLCLGPDKQDSEFIAHAREDIPALLEYIKSLELAIGIRN